jgi:hypothetical protein
MPYGLEPLHIAAEAFAGLVTPVVPRSNVIDSTILDPPSAKGEPILYGVVLPGIDVYDAESVPKVKLGI